MSTLAKYYLLCTARIGEKRHIIDRIPGEQIMAIFTKKEKNLFFRQHDGNWIARESIVGGGDAVQPAGSMLMLQPAGSMLMLQPAGSMQPYRRSPIIII